MNFAQYQSICEYNQLECTVNFSDLMYTSHQIMISLHGYMIGIKMLVCASMVFYGYHMIYGDIELSLIIIVVILLSIQLLLLSVCHNHFQAYWSWPEIGASRVLTPYV